MKSGIFKMWKYARVLWVALTILVSASTVNARQIPICNIALKEGLSLKGMLSDFFDNEQKNFVEEINSGIRTISLNQMWFLNSLNSNNPPNDCFSCLPQGYDECGTEWDSNHPDAHFNLTTGFLMPMDESFIINSENNIASLIFEVNLLRPWWILWYVNIFVLLLLSTAFVVFVTKTISRVKQQEREKAGIAKKIAELEIMALQAQMNPHFIFNSINSIQYFVLSNRTDDVLSYLSDFSKVVRASLANVTKKMVPLQEEIDFLRSYLRIESMRFPDKFDFTVEVKDGLDSLGIMIPPYLIQPFTENTVKHGFTNKQGTGHLTIIFEEFDSETLKCTVTDDGIGRAHATEIKGATAEPVRLHSNVINETRIRLFNTRKKPDRYKVVYTDLIDNEGNSAGLKVEVYLPIEHA